MPTCRCKAWGVRQFHSKCRQRDIAETACRISWEVLAQRALALWNAPSAVGNGIARVVYFACIEGIAYDNMSGRLFLSDRSRHVIRVAFTF